MERVQPRTTPVVIAHSLEWAEPAAIEPERRTVRNLLEGWRVARSSGDIDRVMSFYSEQFASGSRDLRQWRTLLERDTRAQNGRGVHLKDVAILGWKDRSEVLVVTFGELTEGRKTGIVKRQYWGKEAGL